jgi:lysophospholipase L1-like esterase
MKPNHLPRRLTAGLAALLVLALPFVTGCEDGSLNEPQVQNDLFTSYVSLGNSITAGFQSGGINATVQNDAFPALLADQMGTSFNIPTLNAPGCPPPFVSFFNEQGVPAPQRPQGTTEATCGLRAATAQAVNNVAVPGAQTIDAINNQAPSGNPNALTQFILGGRTQVEAALDADPTFATVWLGNNDVLGPALQGTDNVTPPADFQDQYTQVLNRLESNDNFQGGVLVGVTNVIFTPIFSPGPAYAGIAQTGRFPSNFEVDQNCTVEDPNTGLTPLVPLEYGFGLIGQAQANPGATITLDCQAPNTPVLTLEEVGTLATTVQQYNAFIEQQADERGLGYLNPNDVLGLLYQDSGDDPQDPTDDLIPKFPDRDSDQPFGQFFSLDGVHPSSVTHRVVAAQLVQVINQEYDTSLQPPENVPALPDPPSGGE